MRKIFVSNNDQKVYVSSNLQCRMWLQRIKKGLRRIKKWLRETKPRDIGSFFYGIACVLGCTFQVLEITGIFFYFEVLTRITIEFPEQVSTPALSLCPRFTQILDLAAFNEIYNTSYKKPLSVFDRHNIQNIIKLGEIFDLTPSQDDNIFLSCVIRSPLNYSHSEFSSDSCMKDVFTITKYLFMEYMCYAFKIRDNNMTQANHTHIMSRLALSLSFASTFFSIQLNTSIPAVNAIDLTRPIIHSLDSMPYTSLVLTEIFWRKINDIKGFSSDEAEKSRDVNTFMMSYSMIKIERLPVPYTSKCKYYDSYSCLGNCVKDYSLKHFGKQPFQVMTKQSDLEANPELQELGLISSKDLSGNESGPEIQKMEKVCSDRCYQPSCSVDYTLTKTTTATSNNQSMIEIVVGSPTEPFVILDQSAKLPLNDFIRMALSLIGFWLGVSALCLDPTKLLKAWWKTHPKVTPVDVNKVLTPKVTHQHSLYCEKTRKLTRKRIDKEIETLVDDLFFAKKSTSKCTSLCV